MNKGRGQRAIESARDDLKLLYIDDSAAEDDADVWWLQSQYEDLFKECRVRIARYEEPLLGVADGQELVAALVAGPPKGDPWSGMSFSLCVKPDYRRRGLARSLVETFMDYCEEMGFSPEAHVVGEDAMIPLLTDLGFTNEGPIWRY